MDVKIINLPKSKIKIQVHLSGEEFSPYLVQASGELSRDLNIPGFRPGKVPQRILEENIGSERLLEEGAKIALNKIFLKTARGKKLKVLGKAEGKIEKISSEELKGEIEIAVLPEVKLPDYKKISLLEPKKEIKIDNKEIKDSILYLRKSRAKFIRSFTPAAKGNQVEVDYEIRSGGVKIENGEVKGQRFILGEGKFIPGFEEKLVGIKENEEKSFSLTVPSGFGKKEFWGKILDFRLKMKGVFIVEMPELDDDFAKKVGKFKNRKHLEKSVAEGIKVEKEENEKKRWQNLVLEKIAMSADIDLPDILVEEERNKMIENFKKGIEETGLSFESYLSHLKKDFAGFSKDILPEAEKRIRVILCIYEIAKEENIKVSEEELKNNINGILKQQPQLVDKLEGKEGDNFKNYLRENILQRKVIEHLSRGI